MPNNSKNLKILIIDDNQEYCENIKDLLELHYYAAFSAYEGVTALKVAQAEQLDIVLLDLILPGMDGFSILKKLKEDYPKTMVYIVSAFSEEDTIAEELKQAISGHFGNPVNFVELFKMLYSLKKK